MISLFAITLAVSLFAMPVVYNHLQYPYRDLKKFKLRSHRFIKFGIVPAAITLYLGLDLGLEPGLKLVSVNEFRLSGIYNRWHTFRIHLHFI